MLTVPDQPVLDSHPVSATETMLEIGWKVGHNGGDEILHYTVKWSTDATFTVGTESLTLSVLVRASLSQQKGTWTLTGLTKGMVYYTEVGAHNCVGSSTSQVAAYTTACSEN